MDIKKSRCFKICFHLAIRVSSITELMFANLTKRHKDDNQSDTFISILFVSFRYMFILRDQTGFTGGLDSVAGSAEKEIRNQNYLQNGQNYFKNYENSPFERDNSD